VRTNRPLHSCEKIAAEVIGAQVPVWIPQPDHGRLAADRTLWRRIKSSLPVHRSASMRDRYDADVIPCHYDCVLRHHPAIDRDNDFIGVDPEFLQDLICRAPALVERLQGPVRQRYDHGIMYLIGCRIHSFFQSNAFLNAAGED